MKPEISIRAATAADADLLYALMRALAEYEGDVRHLLIDREALRRDGPGGAERFGAFIAESDGEALGFVSYTRTYAIWAAHARLLIDDVYVSDAARGRGVGERLMQAVRELARSEGAGSIRWTVQPGNTRAQAFYARLGATGMERQVWTWWVDGREGGGRKQEMKNEK
ncbi:GNAT family N-acetyltransferase [Arenimonas composti]|uniref:N-acetyltransferase domain-containing protein n=1 Tax=Arenimonas composti TR7-09 = DSM 18010 TaxID=1121013 RepID=A0A091BAR6_9GAMM|nr:GNAT family N-acetyltransferase [Arenimonas composti]KFN48831.1 hypothetical protein P873_13545 [Arenimonas composti TR7-09 = DSM 18010]